MQPFSQFLQTAFDNGDYSTDDVIAFVLPVCKEVLSFHEAGLVAPFGKEGALFITDQQPGSYRVDIDEQWAHAPVLSLDAIIRLFENRKAQHFDVVGNLKMDADVESGSISVSDTSIHLKPNEPLQHPAYIPGYSCFEITAGHHDELTDIFCLGLILGSMALGLDLNDEEDLKQFVAHRTVPARYNHRIHPTISTLITEMTELDRHKRAQDLYDIIHRLEYYRDYDPERQTDLSKVAGWINKELTGRSQFILSKLRNRLFDTSRRNRLLYYKPNMRFVNLTVSSVPTVLHYQSIRPELLFTWNEEISGKVAGMKDIVLNKYLRFEDHLYLPSSLDKIRAESKRDIQEFGFSQLKLVIAFLNWHNLKEDKTERIQSPLLLIPAELRKEKKLKEDHYVLKILDNVAEVNPALANYLKELYGIRLPDFIDLDEMSVAQFYELLRAQVEGANQGITLHFIDKPRIKLIHSVARQTISNYKKRLRHADGRMNSYKDIAYSYEQEHYKPLGLEIFRNRIEHRSSFLEFLVNEDIQLASHHLTATETAKERQLFELADSESNPYSWDFDTCNAVLGNFNYKKMSLVRDYNQVIDQQLQHDVFENLFSTQPKQYKEPQFDLNDPEDWHHVITADPTQTKAILQSRLGESYIIQGPPGTGKSQTITNLVADFIARGKNILFVCEKRAALDVVYHRLRQQGLDELCCYIHDSQGDKRAFIKNLKATYEDFTRNRMDLESITAARIAILQKMKARLKTLEQFHFTGNDTRDESGIAVRRLIERIVELRQHLVALTPVQEEMLPHYKEWLQFGNVLRELSRALEETGAEPAFAEHPFSNVKETVFTEANPQTILNDLLIQAQLLLNEITAVAAEYNIAAENIEQLQQVRGLVQNAVLMLPLTEGDNLSLLDPAGEEAKQFDAAMRLYKQQQDHYKEKQHSNSYWHNKFSAQDTVNALAIAQKHERSFLSFLNGDWRRLKKQLRESYDFSQHQVKPSCTGILEQLKAEYDALDAVQQTRQQLERQYLVDNIDVTSLAIIRLREREDDRELHYLLQHPDANNLVKRLCRLNNIMHAFDIQLQRCLHVYDHKPVGDICDELESIGINADNLADLLPALRKYAVLPDGLRQAVRQLPFTPMQAEAGMAHKTLQHIYRTDRTYANIDIQVIEKAVQHIRQCYKQLLKLNAEYIRASIRRRFLQHVDLCNMATSQLNTEQRQLKKQYNEGRKILENEFGKSIRYKSIRELSEKESGLVLKDLKPVWLMSPLSVSDSLPLDTGFFDVIIFDEASQITLEEGVPALYRAAQTIIVGDDKQMPPANFFTAKVQDPEDLETVDEEDADELLSNDADSLLVQGARKLNSVMLGWHYRSRYETLISYSNHAFYEAGLLTIPDKAIHHTEKNAIDITQPGEAVQHAGALFDRSISFHYLPNSVYEKRVNTDEAQYIARLVRELLRRNIRESIGIVAFSQEQQHTIEDALASLAAQDKQFEQQLEDAGNRTEEDQFTGLFVKNLENVQGDERDIIIMSVCYGFDARRKMIMNFGPVNKKGGEKRLNVIFSRARKHMAVISSIKHQHITNEYNEGANYFKRFLHYAELVSTGNMQMARSILDSLVMDKRKEERMSGTVILQQIRLQLEQRGYEVDEQVGQSAFKCSLAVKKPGDDHYTLGILLDDDGHYNNDNLLEQYFQRPAILKNFGWRFMAVFAKDWLQQPQKMIEQIIRRIEEPEQEAEAEPDTEMPDIPVMETIADTTVSSPVETAQVNKPASPYDHLKFQRLVLTDDTSNKFWEAATEKNKLVVRFGRIGAKGQTQVKTFSDEAAAEREKEKLVREKTGKGYRFD